MAYIQRLSRAHRNPATVVNMLSVVASSGGWWLASGTIAESAVEDYGTDVAPTTAYAGNTITAGNAWTIAARTATGPASEALPNLWMSVANGNTGVRWQLSGTRWQYYSDGTASFIAGATSYPGVVMAICNGTNTEFYYNNVLATTVVDAGAINGLRWGSDYGSGNQWPENLSHVAAYNIALDATQRAALYASMTA